MTEHNNPPAFPSLELGLTSGHTYNKGLTLLDYFAGLAMQSLVTRGNDSAEQVACYAYGRADAMLKERQSWIK